MVIFQMCKSIVLGSVTSVVSNDKESELVDPIHPHFEGSDSGPLVALPGKASFILADDKISPIPSC